YLWVCRSAGNTLDGFAGGRRPALELIKACGGLAPATRSPTAGMDPIDFASQVGDLPLRAREHGIRRAPRLIQHLAGLPPVAPHARPRALTLLRSRLALLPRKVQLLSPCRLGALDGGERLFHAPVLGRQALLRVC